MKLSDKILLLRKKQGLSQEALAEKLNVSRQTVSRWEQGSALPDASNVLQLSRLFEVSADYLLNDDWETVSAAPSANQKAKKLLGRCMAAAGILGNFIIYVLSRMIEVMIPHITYGEGGVKWYHWNRELKGYSYRYFIQEHNLEFLTVLFCFLTAAGLYYVFADRINLKARFRAWKNKKSGS